MGIPVTDSTLTDLLPRSTSGNVDGSAPLSAADLIALLENIRARSEGIKEKVHKTLRTYNTEFVRLIAQTDQTVVNVENLSREVKDVLELLGEKEVGAVNQDSKISHGTTNPMKISAKEKHLESSMRKPVDVEICHLAAEVQRLRSKIKEREEAVVVVKRISAFHDLLLATEKKFVPSTLVEAAEGMTILRKKLGLEDGVEEILTQDQGGDVNVFKLLRDAWSDRYRKLLSLLEDLVSKAIVLDDRGSELRVNPYITCEMMEGGTQGGGVELSSIFTAMDVLAVLDFRLARLGDALFRSVLVPLLKDSRTVISTETLESGAETKLSSVLKWSSGTQSKGAVPEVLYPKIIQITKFFHKNVFGNNDGLMGRFGRIVWPRLAEAIIAGCLIKVIPNETSHLKDFEQIAELTTTFEQELAREGLIANYDQARGDKLSTFASDVEVHFALKKKKQVLAKVRDLLMESDYSLSASTWTSLDDEDIEKRDHRLIYLLSEPCAISLVARSLLGIVHEALEDACLSTPTTALELYHASRDALLLYRAIISVKVGTRPDRLQTAALHHNDCLFIAHELLTFVYQYHEQLPPCLKRVFTFIDLVPLFRQMANEVLDQEIKVVQSEITRGLDRANGFQYTDQQKQYQLVQQALEEVFNSLANVRTRLTPVVGQSTYKKLLGGLINMVVWRIICDITSITDIAVEETVQLQKLLLIVLERLPQLLSPAVVDVSEKCQGKDAVEEHVPLWQKLETLIKLLDMPLVSIYQAWECGDLAQSGFSATEVQKLVKAIFSETSLREEFLQRVGSAS